MQRNLYLAIVATFFGLSVSALPSSAQSIPSERWNAALSAVAHGAGKSGSTNSPYTFLPFRFGGSLDSEGASSSGSGGSSASSSGGSGGSGGGPCQVSSDRASNGSRCGARAASARQGGR
jgi:hypothetical protein